jgi:bacillolysin
MTYGDGDGERFSPLGMAEDVVGHEMVHGITERTAGLRYQRQSGALNESWSDVFGNLIEKWMEREAGTDESDPGWRIGEKIFTPGVDGDGLRSMSRPGTGHDKDPQPGHMRDYKDVSHDNGGVHINSGIPNKAAYEVAMSIGQDKLADVWYRALTSYMTSSSQFTDAANFTVQSAIDLYGKGSVEARAVAAAWESVGLVPSVKPGITG